MFFRFPPTRAEIDLGRVEHNLGELRRLLGAEVKIMAVVKAGGYGHGAAEIARAALGAGASSLGVASLAEGLSLRRAGITAPILLFGLTDPADAPLLAQYRLTPTLSDLETARGLSDSFAGRGERCPVHLKIDTGLGRIGVPPSKSAALIAALSSFPGIELEGVFTHLARADEEEGRDFTAGQLRLFEEVLAGARKEGAEPPLCHAANSAAALLYPQSRYRLVRIGIALYGCYPSPWVERQSAVKLRPALMLKSRIVFLKEMAPQSPLSYGSTYHTDKESLIATVPLGYADGYDRGLSNRGEVLVRGCRAPVVGRICMDQFMIDVSHIEGVSPGDEVVIYGAQGEEQVAVEEAAALLGTINYELLCNIGKRVPRCYFRHGQPVQGSGNTAGNNKW